MTEEVIGQYKCGCTYGPIKKEERLEYCEKHGDDIQSEYEAPTFSFDNTSEINLGQISTSATILEHEKPLTLKELQDAIDELIPPLVYYISKDITEKGSAFFVKETHFHPDFIVLNCEEDLETVKEYLKNHRRLVPSKDYDFFKYQSKLISPYFYPPLMTDKTT